MRKTEEEYDIKAIAFAKAGRMLRNNPLSTVPQPVDKRTTQHRLTHIPKDPKCEACEIGKLAKARAYRARKPEEAFHGED